MPLYGEAKRAYQRRWRRERREAWLAGRCCETCGSTENLEVDHCDPSQKESHNIWSWSKTRIAKELAKCRVLCASCHRLRTAKQNAVLSDDQVTRIRVLSSQGRTQRELAAEFGVSKGTIWSLLVGRTYKWV